MSDDAFIAALEHQLEPEEGVRFTPYLDTRGNRTIGIGHNLEVSPLPADWVTPLTMAQVDMLAARDIAKTIANLDARLPWWRQQPPAIQLAMADMGFNMGVGSGQSGLSSFHQFLGYLQARNYQTAASDLLSTLWARQVPNRAAKIIAQIKTAS